MQAKTIATKLVAKYGTRRAHLKAKARVMRGVGFRLHKGFWLTWMEVGRHVERIGNAEGWT